jgi:hypothetical protein
MTVLVSEIDKFAAFVKDLKHKRKHNAHKRLIKQLNNYSMSFTAALWVAYQLKEEEIPYFQNFKLSRHIDGNHIKLKAIEKLKISPHKVDGLFRQNTYYSVILEIKQIVKDYSVEKFITRTIDRKRSCVIAISLMTREEFDKLLPLWNGYGNYYLDSNYCKVIIDDYPLTPLLNGILD